MATPERPGWYPAPTGGGEQWWNGVAWSESRRDGSIARQAVSHSDPARSSSPAAPAQNARAISNITPPANRAPALPAPYRGPVPPPPYTGAPAHAAPGAAQQASATTSGAVLPLILGIGSLFIGVLGIVAIIAGIRGVTTAGHNPATATSTRTFATIGIVLGAIGLIISTNWLLPLFLALTSSFGLE